MPVKKGEPLKKDKATVQKPQKKQKIAGAEPVSFPVVGIGASAGGLAAFEAFFSGIPADAETGMAFVLVQHLAPDYKSMLVDLISKYTKMKVYEVEDGMAVSPNCVYIIPPCYDMALLNGKLHLLEPALPHGQRLPIDFFFRSLAEDKQEKAICVVLSGTGSDGTQGVRAVKGEGGLAMSQNPESSEYDGMPNSAIATGLIDYILPAAEIFQQLSEYTTHPFGKALAAEHAVEAKNENALKKVLILLRSQTGNDFSQYKISTIGRRVERRMAVNKIESINEYLKFIQTSPAEAEALFRDILIGVTNFFRDPEAFKVLEEQAIPKLFTKKNTGAAVRVWSAGCSTGEEAYSLAILLQEQMEKLKKHFVVQVFATDVDTRAIKKARAGIYPADIAADITPERLARFFTIESDGSYRIHKGIRDMVIFSEHNVIKDPPFSKLDLIICRNLMIYMSRDLQKKLIPLFHYALNPGGMLFLGTSENVSDFENLFNTLERKSKLYERKIGHNDLPRTGFVKYSAPGTMSERGSTREKDKIMFPAKRPLRELTEQGLLQQTGITGVLVDEHGDIFYLHGSAGLFLELAPGETGTNNILEMAREGIKRELATALYKTVKSKEPVSCPGLAIKTYGHTTSVNLSIRPMAADDAEKNEQPLYLVVFEEVHPAPEAVGNSAVLDIEWRQDDDTQIQELKQELKVKENYLQATKEQLETSNEELKSNNEEMQSVNEEMQSTNEELETSKEELQSVNEELTTVNVELQSKLTDLTRVNNDMNNLLAGTGIGTVFVDYQMRILRFTPTITKIINLILSDVGRPVAHVVSNFVEYNTLVDDVSAVLETLVPKEIEVKTKDGKWYTMRIQPYRTVENVIEGAVLTFVDITDHKQISDLLNISEIRYRRLFEAAQEGILILDAERGMIMDVNKYLIEMLGYSREQFIKKTIWDIGLFKDIVANKDNFSELQEKSYMRYKNLPLETADGRRIEVEFISSVYLVDKMKVIQCDIREKAASTSPSR